MNNNDMKTAMFEWVDECCKEYERLYHKRKRLLERLSEYREEANKLMPEKEFLIDAETTLEWLKIICPNRRWDN